jgi:hypothetical protein
MSISFMLQNDVLTVSLDSEVFQISKDNADFSTVLKFISKSDKDGLKQWRVNQSQNAIFEKRVKEAEKIGCSIVGEQLYYNGEPVHNSLSEKIKQYIILGLPYQPLIKFMDNLMLNHSRNSVQQLFDFLQHKNLPITDDGCFLAYKAVREDLKDIYSGTILNEIGTTVSFPRNQVDDDPNNHCSYGLHCGAIEYVKNYARNSKDKILIVKVHPKDVVSVPKDHNFTKIRVCEYKVVDFYTSPLSSNFSGDSSNSFRYESDDSYKETYETICGDDYDDDYDDEQYDECDDLPKDHLEDEEYDLAKYADYIYINGEKYVKESSSNYPTPCRDSKGRFCRRV